ncbi:MAG: ATP-binding protein [Rikenellaceae bacterium]|jgi:AAA+ ATPase superfamily predicted ATPase|nr:ATP-binding protein [Rikenellaceae bacterium]
MRNEIENPFLEQGYVSPKYFCDRERETAEIISALKNGRNLTLISPRRMGKTGLIKHVFHKLRERQSDAITLYMDIFPTQNTGEFIRLFASTVLGQLDSAPQKAMSRIAKFIKSIRPVFTLDEFSGTPQMMIDVVVGNEQTTLREIFDYLASADRPCYIAIDEFQQVAEYPEKGLEAALRTHIQELHNVHFIFSGSRQHVMQQMFLSAKRPFYHSTQTLQIGSIDRDEYYKFADAFFTGSGLSQEVFSFVYDTFDGHTWYIQAIMNRLYAYRVKPDMVMVHRAIEQIVAENTYTYETLLAAYPSGSVRLLKAISKEGAVSEINSGEFIARHHLKAASSVNASLRKLLDRELVYRSRDGYIVYDRFMAIWLRGLPY